MGSAAGIRLSSGHSNVPMTKLILRNVELDLSVHPYCYSFLPVNLFYTMTLGVWGARRALRTSSETKHWPPYTQVGGGN